MKRVPGHFGKVISVVALGLVLLFAAPAAGAHGSGGGGHGGASASHGGGHGRGSVHGGGHGGGWWGWWDGYGHHHYGGYGCCGWGAEVEDPFWDSYFWLDYASDFPYTYGTPPSESSAPAGPYVEPAPMNWYYCPDSKTYYPYVRKCASAWQRVTPTPPH